MWYDMVMWLCYGNVVVLFILGYNFGFSSGNRSPPERTARDLSLGQPQKWYFPGPTRLVSLSLLTENLLRKICAKNGDGTPLEMWK